MSAAETENDKAWKKVFADTAVLADVEANGYATISAKDLRRIGGYSPRLMAKLDTSWNRPKVFRKNGLNILPMSRGTYALFIDRQNRCYHKLPRTQASRRPTIYQSKVKTASFDTLSKGLCSTECEAVDIAHISSLLSTFCGVDKLVLTKRGRFSSQSFELTLPETGKKIEVVNAQIEVDAVYEAPELVVLVEAKIGFKKDFHIRQLHYPYKRLQSETHKRIVPLLLCYHNGEFQLTEFKFGIEFGDLDLVRQEHFLIDEDPVATPNVETILRHAPSPRDPVGVPFPQADDFDKVLDLVSVMDDGAQPEELADVYGFVSRQSDYYLNAAKYLGLINEHDKPTKHGRQLLRYSRVNRTELILKCMIARPAFREAFLQLREKNYNLKTLSKAEVEQIINQTAETSLSHSTADRRASTVRSWLRWLIENCDFLQAQPPPA